MRQAGRSRGCGWRLAALGGFFSLQLLLLAAYSLLLHSRSSSSSSTSTSTSTSTSLLPVPAGEVSYLRPRVVTADSSSPRREYLSLRSLEQRNVRLGLVVRAHAGYAAALTSLLWALQAQENDSHEQPAFTFVVVVPTEPGSASVLREHVSSFSYAYLVPTIEHEIGVDDVTASRNVVGDSKDYRHSETVVVAVMEPSSNDFESQSKVLVQLCTKEWREDRLRGEWPATALDRYCSVNSPVHYHLTDLGVAKLLQLVPQVPYILVTNADNFYSPGFTNSVLSYMKGDKTEEQYDVVLVDMVHRGQVMLVKPEVGHMDLGCAVIRTSVIIGPDEKRLPLTFAESLPSPVAPENWHDADFWFINALIQRRGARVGILRQVLFVHN